MLRLYLHLGGYFQLKCFVLHYIENNLQFTEFFIVLGNMDGISTFYGKYFVRKVLFTGLDPHKKDLDFNEFCRFEMQHCISVCYCSLVRCSRLIYVKS